jgi:hypothetical protein
MALLMSVSQTSPVWAGFRAKAGEVGGAAGDVEHALAGRARGDLDGEFLPDPVQARPT